MKTPLPTLALVCLTGYVLPASAAEHLMHVGEVLTSKGGNDAIQYVELSDKNNEPFPSTQYVLEVFDAAGVSQGDVFLDQPKLKAEQVAFLVATQEAGTEFGKTPDAILNSHLDPAGGTVCFGKKVASANSYIHCLKWGTATTPTGTSTKLETGDAPGDGKSLQLQSDGSYKVADPTPKAANVAPSSGAVDMASSTAVDLATTSSGGGGGGGGGGCAASGEGVATGSGVLVALVAAALAFVTRRRRA